MTTVCVRRGYRLLGTQERRGSVTSSSRTPPDRSRGTSRTKKHACRDPSLRSGSGCRPSGQREDGASGSAGVLTHVLDPPAPSVAVRYDRNRPRLDQQKRSRQTSSPSARSLRPAGGWPNPATPAPAGTVGASRPSQPRQRRLRVAKGARRIDNAPPPSSQAPRWGEARKGRTN